MPTFRRYIDPKTGDYAIVNGNPKEDTGIASKIVLALKTRKGSSAVNPTFGSRFHEIRKIDGSTPRRVETMAKLALVHLKDEIKALKVTANVEGGRIDLYLEYQDRSGNKNDLRYQVALGDSV